MGLVEGLVGDPVADASKEALVEQDRLERRFALDEQFVELFGVGKLVETVEPEFLDARIGFGILGQPQTPKAASVGEGDPASLLSLDQELEKAGNP